MGWINYHFGRHEDMSVFLKDNCLESYTLGIDTKIEIRAHCIRVLDNADLGCRERVDRAYAHRFD